MQLNAFPRGTLFRTCPKCQVQYHSKTKKGFLKFFELKKLQCRKCRNLRHYLQAKKTEKYKIRRATKEKYGSAKEHKCSWCKDQATQWHHVGKYHRDRVQPVCDFCHKKIHESLKKIRESFA